MFPTPKNTPIVHLLGPRQTLAVQRLGYPQRQQEIKQLRPWPVSKKMPSAKIRDSKVLIRTSKADN